MDFLAAGPGGDRTLIQVAADLSEKPVRDREVRALTDALPSHRGTGALLLTLPGTDVRAAQADAPARTTIRTAWEWMLDAGPTRTAAPR